MTPAEPTDAQTPRGWELDVLDQLLEERYHVERLLGRGGMAAVYEGLDKVCDRRVVVKIPHPALFRDPRFSRRFENEVRSQIALDHPGVAKVLDRGMNGDLPFVVIQYLRGGSLGQRAKRLGGPMDPEDVLDWMGPVADTLDFIHHRQMVHRDVKPGNILFDEDGNVFLSDFGISKAMGGGDSVTTMSGLVPGTPGYMAPEQIRGQSVSGTADQYGLAATVYEMLSGRLPYEDATPLAVIAKKQVQDPIPLAEVAPHLPKSVVNVVERGLARSPRQRYASCTDFALAYEDALGDHASAERRATSFGVPFLWVFFCVAASIVVGVAYLLLRERLGLP